MLEGGQITDQERLEDEILEQNGGDYPTILLYGTSTTDLALLGKDEINDIAHNSYYKPSDFKRNLFDEQKFDLQRKSDRGLLKQKKVTAGLESIEKLSVAEDLHN